MKRKKAAAWLLILALALCIAAAVYFHAGPDGDVVNPWVREYVPGEEGVVGSVDRERFESVSADFAIGADRDGRAVFKDPDKAFDTFRRLYADGIALIRREFSLRPLSRRNMGDYKTYGWQVTGGDPEARDQAVFVSSFLDIYENSFTQ